MRNVRRVVHGEADADEDIDRGDPADGHIPVVHEPQRVHDGQADADDDPHRHARIRHQERHNDENDGTADEQVPHELGVNDTNLLPVQEVKAVREGVGVNPAHICAHARHSCVAVCALVCARKRELAVEAGGLQALRHVAASRQSAHRAVHLAIRVVPAQRASEAAAWRAAVPRVERGVESAPVGEHGVRVCARRAEARRGSGCLCRAHCPLHEFLVPAVDLNILVDQL
mmetsp:Transcript_30011/g.69800  ORF Transcript_30011/g.69800 Transcript_30011/m.69800 type:complete len:229 (-) Transcript_30011:1194-1880(-)